MIDEYVEAFRGKFAAAVKEWESASADATDARRGVLVAWSLSAIPFIMIDIYRDPAKVTRWDPLLREIFGGRGPALADDIEARVSSWRSWCAEEMVPLDWRYEPSEYARQHGAKLEIPGGMPCPWCAAHCEEIVIDGDRSMIARCEWNPEHVVSWIPWGG